MPVCHQYAFAVNLWNCFDGQPKVDRTVSIDLQHFDVMKFDVFYM